MTGKQIYQWSACPIDTSGSIVSVSVAFALARLCSKNSIRQLFMSALRWENDDFDAQFWLVVHFEINFI
mgnify:FL=1